MLSVPGPEKEPESLGPGRAWAMMSFMQGVWLQPVWGEGPTVACLPGNLLCEKHALMTV